MNQQIRRQRQDNIQQTIRNETENKTKQRNKLSNKTGEKTIKDRQEHKIRLKNAKKTQILTKQ